MSNIEVSTRSHCEPTGHFQMSSPIIKLQSSDGEILQIEVKSAQLFLHLKTMLDDLGVEENEVISIPQSGPKISGAILRKIIQWANHHKDDRASVEDDEKKVQPMDDISSWDTEFLQVDPTIIFQMIRAANYLNITGLLDVTCKKVAKMIKGMTVVQVRERFNIQNDFSPDEEHQVRRENKWFQEIDSEENNGRSVNDSVMDTIPAGSIQYIDSEAGQVIKECIGNSVVLRKIFTHFSHAQLLKYSCVNKLWNDESRSVMKKRGNVTARLKCTYFYPNCQDLEDFGLVLRDMKYVPYSGLTIEIEIDSKWHVGTPAVLQSTYESILDRLTLKHLSIKLVGNWSKYRDCSTFLLVKKLLHDFSGDLEQLSLNIEKKRIAFVEQVVGDCTFPRLNILKLLETTSTSDGAYTDYMDALVPLAPNLKELHVYGKINLMENVLDGSSAMLLYKPIERYPFSRISHGVFEAIRLEKLQLFCTGPDMDFERFTRITRLLLQAPCTSRLRELCVDDVLAVSLMSYGISLKNVNKLEISIRHYQLELVQSQVLRILKNFDFTRIFPNLREVCFSVVFVYSELSRYYTNTVVEQESAVHREPKPDRAANIKGLHLRPGSLTNETAPFFVEMFPSIEKLRILQVEGEEVPYRSIWKNWVGLKVLQVETRTQRIANLDSVFCGIFPEEVAQLKQKDEEYLKKVNIVPVMPAITCLKSLKILKLMRVKHWYGIWSDVDKEGARARMFSKVTEFIAFQRCPSLAVSLEFRSSH